MKMFLSLVAVLLIAVTIKAQTPTELYNQGVDLMTQQQYEQAIEKFKAAALADANHKESRLGLATAYFKLSQWDNAIIALKEVMTLAPDDMAALEMLAKAQLNAKKYADAIISFDKLIAVKTDNPDLYMFLGNSAAGNKDDVKAEKAYLKAIELKTTTVSVYHKLAIMYQKQKKMKDAIAILEKALPVKEDQKTYYYLGKFLYVDKGFVKAEEYLKKAFEMDSKDEDSAYYLTKTYIELKKFADAVTVGEALITLKKTEPKYCAALGDAYRLNGEKDNALKTYQAGAQYSGEYGTYCTQMIDFLKKQK